MKTSLYLDLLEDCLLGVNDTLLRHSPRKALAPLDKPQGIIRPFVQKQFRHRGWIIARWAQLEREPIEKGITWPRAGETMIGRARMRNVRQCVESIIRDDIPGDLIETGVWRGGTCIYMRGILAAHEVDDRDVWVADSFQGLPRPNATYPADDGADFHTFDALAVSAEEVRANFARYHLLDEHVKFAEGWFRDTLPTLGERTWAVARLDGDMYESTTDALSNLYANLSPGGYLIIDDYHAIPACHEAVHDFRAEHRISDPVQTIDEAGGAFWRKS